MSNVNVPETESETGNDDDPTKTDSLLRRRVDEETPASEEETKSTAEETASISTAEEPWIPELAETPETDADATSLFEADEEETTDEERAADEAPMTEDLASVDETSENTGWLSIEDITDSELPTTDEATTEEESVGAKERETEADALETSVEEETTEEFSELEIETE
ncbi:hypothetical protein WICPIJ_009101 [Wickerhamomyces pijperi]|uniref:Uncharacterized protein n=1 Tax=Wickerhamomyces pijperi TaxID=599730 RepID=A0A9P8TFA5_WICPI|nr:hypothetical protein WICPIJ_009101 [Wickerhamomyces pijperi]